MLYNDFMIPENETYELEGRVYQNPETSRDEQMAFIDNLRATQQANNEQIRTQTDNLGTAVPSQMGGLIGPESYFTARYQTAPTNQTVASLRSAAQASALNTALSNLQNQYQERYNQAYRNYQKRASSSGSGSSDGSTTTTKDGVSEESAGDNAIVVDQKDISGTSAPREGLSETSYYRDGHWYTEYDDGSLYEDGVLVRGATRGSGLAQGNGGDNNTNINRARYYANPYAGTLNNEGGGGW